MHNRDADTSVSGAAIQDLIETCRTLKLVDTKELKQLGLCDSIQSLDARVRESSLIALWRKLEHSDYNEEIGLKLGQTINPKAKGLLASWVSQSANLKEALTTFTENTPLMNPSEKWQIHRHNNQCQLSFTLDQSKHYPKIAIDRSMSGIVSWARELSQHPFPLQSASFTFKVPSNTQAYVDIFGPHTNFSAEQNSLVFDTALLDLPVINSNVLLKSMISDRALITLAAMREGTPLNQEVNLRIDEALSRGHVLSVQQLCADLGLSRQTLHRRLKKHNTDFLSLLDESRKERARDLLLKGRQSVTSISLNLGFQDTSSFYKAFKRWFACSPKEFVAQQQQSDGDAR